MRDSDHKTRYFSFKLPTDKGEFDEKLGINRIILKKDDIIDYFDCEYHHFVQGACCENGLIYSLEGFGGDKINPPALRIVSPKDKKQIKFIGFEDYGELEEPELIYFENGICYYCDNPGNLSIIEF